VSLCLGGFFLPLRHGGTEPPPQSCQANTYNKISIRLTSFSSFTLYSFIFEYSNFLSTGQIELTYKKVTLMKIVIADDSPLLRERIKSLVLTVREVEIVGEAADGMEALKLIEDTDPDLAILDIRMPELSGIDVLKKIKESGRRTKVCILTNYPYPQYKERCMAEGADYFFDKNKDFQKITTMIAELAQVHPGDLHE
jgi:CheY-like chemotaxis protein